MDFALEDPAQFSIKPSQAQDVAISSFDICLPLDVSYAGQSNSVDPPLDIYEFIDPASSTVSIPGCSLEALKTYDFDVEVYYTDIPSTKIEVQFSIIVLSETFKVEMLIEEDEID